MRLGDSLRQKTRSKQEAEGKTEDELRKLYVIDRIVESSTRAANQGLSYVNVSLPLLSDELKNSLKNEGIQIMMTNSDWKDYNHPKYRYLYMIEWD